MGIIETAVRVATGADRRAPDHFYVNGIKYIADENVGLGKWRAYDTTTVALNPADFAFRKEQVRERATVVVSPPTKAPLRTVTRWHLPADTRAVMVDEIIAEQVKAGGVDTEGARHEAERWLAMVCECICDGVRATTDESALRLAGSDSNPRTGWCAWEHIGMSENAVYAGKPLGRPR